MWKFVAALALIAVSFGLGFYFGQRPVGTLQQTVSDLQRSITDMSRNIYDTTMGIERDLRRRQALIDTKSRVVQAKSELFDKNFGEAAKQLGEAAETLGKCHEGCETRRVDPRLAGADRNASGSESWNCRWGKRCRSRNSMKFNGRSTGS